MGIGSFLFGSGGGLTKNQQRILDRELAVLDPNDLAGITSYARQRVEPTFRAARGRIASRYQNADAPVTIGGRTGEEISLAGEEAGSIADIIEQEKQQRRALRQYLLSLKLRPKPATQGLFGLAGEAIGSYFGGKAGAKLGKRAAPGVQVPDEMDYSMYG